MKFKRVVSLVSGIALLCSVSAFAATSKSDTKEVEATSTRGANDLFYEDFTGVEPGVVPGTVSGSTNDYGYVTTDTSDIGGGIEKNCLMIVDTTPAREYQGPGATFNIGSYSAENGIISVEFRFKYIPDDQSSYVNFEMQFNGSNGMLSRTVSASDNGAFIANFGADGSQTIRNSPFTHNVWNTYRVYFDFENHVMDVYYEEEATGGVVAAYANIPFDETMNNLSRVYFNVQVFSGTLCFDYAKVTKENARLDVAAIEEEMSASIVKGVPAEQIPAPVSTPVKDRINIKMDGIYKYTTTAPILSGDTVLVSAKNIGNFFGMAYIKTADSYTLTNAENEIVFSADGSSATNSGKPLSLFASCVVEGNQLMVPIADIAEALGYSASYSADTNEVTITTSGAASSAAQGATQTEAADEATAE